MFQRIQTLFIIGAFAACATCFFLPFWLYTGTNPDYAYRVSLFAIKLISGEEQIIDLGTIPILVIVAVSTILTIVSLFNFKNRQRQIKINNYNVFLTILFIGTIYLWIPHMIDGFLRTAVMHWQFGLIMPLFSMVFLIIANIFIKKDEKLVKSADRLR
jgi:hypothetical protein